MPASDKHGLGSSLLFFRHPSQHPSDASFDVYKLTSGCGLIRIRVGMKSEVEALSQTDLVHWSQDVWELQEKAIAARGGGQVVDREFTVFELRPLYERELAGQCGELLVNLYFRRPLPSIRGFGGWSRRCAAGPLRFLLEWNKARWEGDNDFVSHRNG